jgi:hypothetical protein
MFEYLLPDGTALPENEVIKLAVQKGLTTEDYVKKNKLALRPKQKKAAVKKEVAKPVAKEVAAAPSVKTPKINLQSVPGVNDFGSKITEADKAFDFSKKGQTEEYTAKINEKYRLGKEKAKREQKLYDEKYGDDSQLSIDKKNELLKIRDIEEPTSVHPWQLKGQDVDVTPKLNEKLNALGIEVENNQLSNAIVLKPIGYISNQDGSNLDVPLSIDMADNDNVKAQKINDYISLYKKDNYLDEVKARQKGKYETYKKAVTPPELSRDQLIKRIQETKKKKFLGISLEKGSAGGEGAAFAKEVTEKDFATPIEFRQYKDWLAGKEMDPPSPGELIMYDQQYRDEFINKKSSAYASSLDKNDRKDFEILTQDIKKQGDLNIYKFKKEAEIFNQASKDYNKLQEDFKKDPSIGNKKILATSYIDLVKKQNELQDQEVSIRKYEKDYKNFVAPSITNFSANYDRLSELTTGFKGLVSSTGVALAETAGVIESAFSDEKMDEIRKRDVFGVYDLARSLNKEKQSYQKAVGIENITSVSDAGRWLAGSSINAIPSLSMALTGQAALPLFFATGFGGKAEQFIAEEEAAVKRLKENTYLLENTTDSAQAQSIQKQIDADKEILAIPEWKKVTAETIYGAAEVVFEKLGTLEILKGISKATNYLPKKSLSEGLKWASKDILKTFNREGLSEVATQAVDNFTDVYLLGENKNVWDGFVETYAQGGLVGGALSTIPSSTVIGQAYRSEIATKKEQKEIADIVNKISKLTNVPGYNLNQALPLGRLTKEVQEMVDKLTARKDGIYAGMDERLSRSLTLDQLKQVGDLNRQIRDINNNLKSAASNSDISPGQLKELQDQYREEFTKLIEQKENILGDPIIKADNAKAATSRNFKFDSTAGYSLYNQRMASESLQGVVNNFKTLNPEQKSKLYSNTRENLLAENENADVSDKNIEKVTLNNYVKDHYKNLILQGLDNSKAYAANNDIDVDFQTFETNGPTELVKQYKASDEYAVATPPTRNRYIKELSSGQVDGTSFTFNGKPKVFIDLAVASENLRTGIASHELLHVVVASKFSDDKANKQGEALLNYIENRDKDLFALVSQRIKNSYTEKGKKDEVLYDKGGQIIKDSNYYLEVLNAVSDLAADGRRLKPDTINQFRKFLNGILGDKFQFDIDQGTEVYSFVRDFNKASHFGGKTKYTVKQLANIDPDDEADQPKQNLKFSKAAVEEIQKKIDKLEEQYDNDQIEYDYYENQIKLYEEQLEKAKLQPEVEKPKTEKPKAVETEEQAVRKIIQNEKGAISSDKVQQIYNTKGTAGADEIIKLFKPITARIVDKRRDAPGFNKELLTDEIESGKGGILDLIMKYDPKGGVPLAAYINKYLPFRAITSSRRVLDPDFTSDVETEVNVKATETADQGMTVNAPEKPKYKNALESNILEPNVLDSATKKIISTVRLLKNRIDAPVTLNRTVTPLIAEIRDEIGKQLDIDIKTMLGGKKDGVLKKQLLKSKRYILENMTTTWLMGKDGQGGIPQAIQKQVDGKWVSFPDWVGKKIDRETTSTDLAGRTSGAELVRRLPNVFNNVSNEEFLAQIIGPDGNPLRGRKESVSKVMAEEIAFDIINADLVEQGPIFEALSANQERLGVEVLENLPVVFAKQADRGNIKFSISKKLSTLPLNTQEYFFSDENYNSVINDLTNINAGNFPPKASYIKNVFNNVYDTNRISQNDLDEIANDFSTYLDKFKALPLKKLNSAEEKQFLSDYIKKSAEVGGNSLEGFVEDIQKIGEKKRTVTDSFKDSVALKDMYNTLDNFVYNIKSNPKSSEWYRMLGNFLATQAQIGDDTFITKDGLLLKAKGIDFAMQKREGGPRSKINKTTGEISEKGFSYQPFSDKPSFWNFIKDALNIEKLPAGYNINLKTNEADSGSGLYENKSNAEYLENKKNTTNANREFLYELLDFIYNPSNGVNDETKAMIWASLNSSVESPLRKSGMVKWIFVDDNKSYKGGKLVYEHLTSVNKKKFELHNLFSSNVDNKKEAFNKLMEDYNVAVIPKSMDDEITKSGFKTEPLKGDQSEGGRYYNILTAGIKKLFYLEALDKNAKQKYLGKEFVKAVRNFDYENSQKIAAVAYSTKLSKTPKGISVFDFDDTVGITSGSVLYTMPNGKSGKLNAEEFAKNGSKLLEDGAVFDFSEFSKVVDGKPGPMVQKMKKMIGKFGPDNFFILTARPADSAGPIHEFLKSIDINIPLENITGLGNSTAQAKADWITNKAAEGYNDFYFADDAIQNVKAVKDALDVLDVKSKIQQAKLKFSKTISSEFNKILEENVGVKAEEAFSAIVAKRKGKAIGKYRFFVPPSAADLELLIYDFLGYGKTGEKQQQFFNKALFEPYADGIALIDAAKQSIKNDYKALLKAFPEVSKELGKLTPDGNFTYDQAIRVSMWAGMGEEVPGISEDEVKELSAFVNQDPDLAAFKAGLIATGRQDAGWIAPTEYWDSESIVSDLYNITEKVGRKKYLAEFIENSNEMFSKENLNKIEAIYGSNFRDALEDSIYSMANGTNRESGPGRINAAWLNWINNSTGAIMFWNTRSAVLQTIGSINYLNWRDNNPLNAAKAFANQPQYWKDFAYIWNSDKMKERRSGLKEDVSSSEIANAAAGTTSKANAIISYLLKKGFLPTQIGDSFAIASGGAAFYRNRINYNLKQGMTEAEAEAEAWKEFLKVTDQTQQSGDPRDISQQQRSAAGRLVLAFQNTSMQQARLVKKAGLDLVNRRGDAKTNISKIVYYTAVQNIIFGALQSALFATMFSDDDDEEKEKKKQTAKDKWLDIGNNIVDTILRGSGMAGAIVATLKNVYLKYNEESKKGFKAEYAKVLIEAANVAPAIGSKISKGFGAMRTKEFEKDVIAKRGWSVTADGKLNLSPSYSVLGQGIEATTNLPANRFVNKVNNLSEALDSRNKSWQRIALAVGYTPYTVGVENEENEVIKAEAKVMKKAEGIEKAIETRRKNKEEFSKLPWEEQQKIKKQRKQERAKLKAKKRNIYK